VTAVKLNSKLATYASDALTAHVPSLYSNLGKRIVGVVELAAVERTQAAPDEDKEASVTLQIKHLEVASVDQEDNIRHALRALHTQRTAYGTITEAGDIELSETTLSRCAGEVNAVEAARLHIAIDRWHDYARQALANSKLTGTELRRELTTIADALHATIYPPTIKAEG
jgi:hypothetical protein